MRDKLELAIATALPLIILLLPTDIIPIQGLSVVEHRLIAIFVMALLFWILEPIPVFATSVYVTHGHSQPAHPDHGGSGNNSANYGAIWWHKISCAGCRFCLLAGHGLGLTICERLVGNYNGEITVKSRPGKTVFKVKLPL